MRSRFTRSVAQEVAKLTPIKAALDAPFQARKKSASRFLVQATRAALQPQVNDVMDSLNCN